MLYNLTQHKRIQQKIIKINTGIETIVTSKSTLIPIQYLEKIKNNFITKKVLSLKYILTSSAGLLN